ncbi:MAG: DUF4493 domain-containing protein [Bacteroidaceae bacterium]|nr:DUF4493 domain-containing protein [Bacteroidaceae bacterium]
MTADKPSCGRLCLTLLDATQPVVVRSSDSEVQFAVMILDSEASVVRQYQSGQIPQVIDLPVGRYTLRAYTDNQSSWATANGGLGEACLFGDTVVQIKEDNTAYCRYKVPMINYGVCLTLPERFALLFPEYTFTVHSADRTVSLEDGQTAYFSADNGFAYNLMTANTDGVVHQTTEVTVSDQEAGKIYNIRYYYN